MSACRRRLHDPFLHVMWLQPPFFSMEVLHLGQHLVLDTSQLYVSESSLHLTSHRFRSSHDEGRWSSRLQL